MQSVLSSSVQYLLAVSKFSSLYPALSKISLQVQGCRPPFFFLLFLNLFSPASSVQKHLKIFTVSPGSGHLLMSIRHLRKKPSVPTCLATVSSPYVFLVLLLAWTQVHVRWITFSCAKTEHVIQHISVNIYLDVDTDLNNLCSSSFGSL